jgi:hypothetical protein
MGAASLERCDPARLPAGAGERARKAAQPALEGYERAPGAWIALKRVERDRGQRGTGADGSEGGGRRTCGS